MPTQLHDINSTTLTGNFSIGPMGGCEFSDKFVIAFNVVLVLILIPILNFVLFPFLREYMPNMLKRIGMGMFLSLLAQISTLAISGAGARRSWANNDRQCMFYADFETDPPDYKYSPVSEFYVLIPLVLITMAEVFIHISSELQW